MSVEKASVLQWKCDACGDKTHMQETASRPKGWTVAIRPYLPEIADPEEIDLCGFCSTRIRGAFDSARHKV